MFVALFESQRIVPAARNIKDFESLMKTHYEYIVLLDSHVAQLAALVKLADANGKKLLLHADLVHGLKNDEYAAEFLCQQIRPRGLISTRTQVVSVAKKKGLIGIQRIFLLDTHALETSYRLLETSRPDYIEVLPGVIPQVIHEIHRKTRIPMLAGGLIRTLAEVRSALDAGAVAVTTSSPDLWKVSRSLMEERA